MVLKQFWYLWFYMCVEERETKEEKGREKRGEGRGGEKGREKRRMRESEERRERREGNCCSVFLKDQGRELYRQI